MRKLKRLAAAVLVLCVSGALFEQTGRYRDRRRFPQIGRSVDIGGRTLNISCMGSGSPTVVFDTFGHQSGYSWIAVQNEVAKHTRACWYDRAGYGWSELGSGRRTFQSVAADLHALLTQAGIPFPVVLVGAGDAASHIRVYYGDYPAEVAGIVMLDANDVDDPKQEVPDAEKGGFQRLFGAGAARARRAACWTRPLVGRVGLIRLFSAFQKPRGTNSFGLTVTQQAELDQMSDNGSTQQSAEACDREESMLQARAAGSLGEIPLVVVAPDSGQPAAGARDSVEAAWKKYRIGEVPLALSRLSTRGRVVPVEGGLTKDIVVRAILDVLGVTAATQAGTHDR